MRRICGFDKAVLMETLSLSLSCTGTTNGLNDLGLGSLVGPMGTFPLDTFEKYPWEPPGPST